MILARVSEGATALCVAEGGDRWQVAYGEKAFETGKHYFEVQVVRYAAAAEVAPGEHALRFAMRT